jgi:hypothetical protein
MWSSSSALSGRNRDVDNISYGLHGFFALAQLEMASDMSSASGSSGEIDFREPMP